MLTLLAMVLEGDWYRGALAGNCLLMFFGLLPLWRCLPPDGAGSVLPPEVLAAIVYLSTPWIYRISTIAYAEGDCASFCSRHCWR